METVETKPKKTKKLAGAIFVYLGPRKKFRTGSGARDRFSNLFQQSSPRHTRQLTVRSDGKIRPHMTRELRRRQYASVTFRSRFIECVFYFYLGEELKGRIYLFFVFFFTPPLIGARASFETLTPRRRRLRQHPPLSSPPRRNACNLSISLSYHVSYCAGANE